MMRKCRNEKTRMTGVRGERFNFFLYQLLAQEDDEEKSNKN